ncbi:MAG: ATP-binding protein, partial [Candidatus Marinimicrobia bacterium]|nr:ATP-binding protein [Candidatus Neomarinimicrobiota bacterium]
LSLKIRDNNDLSKMADNIHYAGLKAASLTQQLLAFSRKQVLEMKVTNLNIITEDMTRMLGRLIGENIQLKMFLSEETGNIMADASQVGQILMNLVVNARDAMPDGGILTIETSEIYIENQYTTRHLYFKAGHYSMISITDTGRGMTPELRDKIFEPFFTTKGPGKGTGLGLSTVYGIVKQHNGYIHVYSEPDHGTCFKIYLPRVSGEIESLDVKEVFHMRGGSETILVVDDDDSIRSLIIDTLQPLGYNIIPASTGAEALELSRMIEQDIDLLLSDVIMPGINGKQLADIIVQEQPQIRVILMSGYTDNVIAHHGVLQSDYILINKPLLPLALTSKIREVLDHTQEIKNTETNVS